MHAITRRTILAFAAEHPDAADALDRWYRVTKLADWRSLQDVRKVFPSADGVSVDGGDTMTVFNIGGNKYRLIAYIAYRNGKVYIKQFLTHAEYSKEGWKGSR
ncbi:MAG: type II toxin-antitoxin system HigB family toxin [Planctomycetota bacterium]